MKQSVVDLDIAIRNKVFSLNLEEPFTFDEEFMEDASELGLGTLLDQNLPFFSFQKLILSSRRVGPSKVSPTRYYGNFSITYLTKNPNLIRDQRFLESIADKFSEQTLDGIRFRTFTPYSPSKDSGFTSYSGVIDFDFELYRGG